MPPKRKGARSKKKKKGRQATATAAARGGKPNGKSSANNKHTSLDSDPLLPQNLTDGAKTTPANESVGAYYQQYKKATEAFKNGLGALLPSSFRLKSVDDLARGSTHVLDASLDLVIFIRNIMEDSSSSSKSDFDEDDYMSVMNAVNDLPEEEQKDLLEKFQCVLVPNHLIANLDTSINLRSKILKMYAVEGSADNGHRHILKVLEYCRRALKACRNKTKVVQRIAKHLRWSKKNMTSTLRSDASDEMTDDEEKVAAETTEDIDLFANRFAALASIYGEEDENDEEEIEDIDDDIQVIIQKRKNGIDTTPVTEETDMYTIEELINGDDRLQACSFLYTMEQLMGIVASHYTMLKNDAIATKSSDLKMLMQCAMVANTCMNSVQHAEATLALNYPHLSSFYAVLVIVFVPNYLPLFEEMVLSHATEVARNKCDKATLIQFFGSIVECCFHNRDDERRKKLQQQFIRKMGLEKQQREVEKLVHAAQIHMEIQVSFKINTGDIEELCNMFESQLGREISNEWLGAHTYIGGKHSIISTLYWLQCLMSISNNRTKLISKPGQEHIFGGMWNEEHNLADGIRGDMDELLCGSILPELLECCKGRNAPRRIHILDSITPYTPQTLPILHMLRSHMKGNQENSIPASLAFGIHCLLTSIFSLQGGGDVTRHAVHTEQSWNKLFQKLEEHKKETDVPNHVNFFSNVGRFCTLRYLSTPKGNPSTAVSAQMAFFNPLMAGSYLLFANYVIGLGLGSVSVDSIGQLRFVMHLYNAFIQTGLLKEDDDDIPYLLKKVDVVFKDTRALWVLKERPKQGEFCRQFLFSWGYTPQAATKAMANYSDLTLSERPHNNIRKIKPILPEEMSASYRMVMNRDFTDMEDTYSIKNYTEEQKKEQEVFVKTLSNINMTRDMMDEDEEKVFFTNWTQVGCIFNEFIRAMMKEFGWDQMTRNYIYGVRSDNARNSNKFRDSDVNLESQSFSVIISHEILQAMDKDANCAIGKQCAEFMKNYFNSIDEKEYSYLVTDVVEGTTCSLHGHSDDELKVMSISKLKKVAMKIGVDVSGCIEKKEIVELLSGRKDDSPFISGSKVLKTTLEGKDPTDCHLQFPPHGDGEMDTPFHAMLLYKYTKRNEAKVRLILPGKNSPVTEVGGYPYEQKPPQLVPLPSGKYRHIASFSLKELRQLGWDGAIYNSETLGTWVPFIDGYDSDENDEYELFNKREARSAGIIGLPIDMRGKLAMAPGVNGETRYMQLKR